MMHAIITDIRFTSDDGLFRSATDLAASTLSVAQAQIWATSKPAAARVFTVETQC